MKLDTINEAIRAWYNINDYAFETFNLLNQGVLFRINPEVMPPLESYQKEKKMHVHAYPGIIDGELKFFLINSEKDKHNLILAKNEPLNKYIFVADVTGMDASLVSKLNTSKPSEKRSLSLSEAMNRISRWSLIKESWIKNRINNTEGMFQAISIPLIDLKPNCDIYAFFALTETKTKNKYQADLIIWDCYNKEINSVNSFDSLDDLCRPVPPFDGEYVLMEDFGLLKASDV
jgi:hypothetical protein